LDVDEMQHFYILCKSVVVKYKGFTVKGLNDTALHVHTLELRNITCHMGSYSVTCHSTQLNTPRLTPARKAGTRFTYPGRMED